MEEKRLECPMMLQIHRSDTLMQLLIDLPPLQHGDLTYSYEQIHVAYESLYSIIDSFLDIEISNI